MSQSDNFTIDLPGATDSRDTPAENSVTGASANDANETMTFMSGLDGTGSVVSSATAATVAAGTAVQAFENFTGATINDPAHAAASNTVALADLGTIVHAAPEVAPLHAPSVGVADSGERGGGTGAGSVRGQARP